MGAIKVPTNFNIELEFEIPEFYRRLSALVIDGLIIYFYLRIASAIFESMLRNSDLGLNDRYDLSAWLLIFEVPYLIYFPIQEITMNGQTVGKKLMGLRVVNENGGRASISQFLIRWLIRDVWFVFLLRNVASVSDPGQNMEAVFLMIIILVYLVIDIVLVVSSRKGQRLGDILAHTIIIRTQQRSNIEETVFQEVADSYVPSFPAIMQLSDKDINAIKSILETARRKGDYSIAENASFKIKSHLNIETSMSAFDFLEVLLKDYNYLSTK